MRSSDAFQKRNGEEWRNAITDVFGQKPRHSASWDDLDDILRTLRPFMASNRNHALLPKGGGVDFSSVDDGREPHTIEFNVGDDAVYVVKPKSLEFQYIEKDPAQSFFILDLMRMKPTGVYETYGNWDSEELLDLGSADYVDRSVWDQGFI